MARCLLATIVVNFTAFSNGTAGVVPDDTNEESRWTPLRGDGAGIVGCCQHYPRCGVRHFGDHSMICEYAVVICPKTGDKCDHRNCMQECMRAKYAGVKLATFADCFRIYTTYAEVGEKRKREVVASVKSCLGMVGLDESAHVDAVTYRVFKSIVSSLEESSMTKSTISSKLSMFAAISGEKLRDRYDDEGFARPMFDMPRIRVPKKKVVIMTSEQDCKVDGWMRALSCSSKAIDQRMFVALWFERLFAVRPGDINRLTWDCIHIDGSVVRLVYRPHKTEKCAGRDDPIVIPPKLWAWVAPFYRPGEPLIARIRAARSDSTRNRAIWERINRQFRKWGICDEGFHGKASYINRRQRLTEAFLKDGIRGSSALGKNTPKVQMEHYISPGEYAA